jgi:photosystem II stability/assembly factor-like uncharacterized protein
LSFDLFVAFNICGTIYYMKKIITTGVLLSFVWLLSACSLSPKSSSQRSEETFVLSQSIWRSSDGGKTWEVKNQGQGRPNATSIDILSLAVNPYDGAHLYAGLRQGGILESDSGGDRWKYINYQSAKVYGLSLDQVNGRTLFASGVWEKRGKMFRTENAGVDWKEIYTSPSDGPLVVSLATDRRNPDVLYISTSDNEVLKSTDGGVSWKNIYSSSAPVLKIGVDYADSNLIYLISNTGAVLRSSDGGNTFEDLAEKIRLSFTNYGGNQFSVLRTDPSVPGRVFLAGAGGLFVSSDRGETWAKIQTLNNPQTFPIRALAINPKNSQEIIYGASQATYKSDDGGTTWSTSQFDNGMLVNVLEYSSTDPSVIYLGFVKN